MITLDNPEMILFLGGAGAWTLYLMTLLAFFIGCFFAGIAGALLGHWIGFLNAEQFILLGARRLVVRARADSDRDLDAGPRG